MSTELSRFEFPATTSQLRVLNIDGEPWFVATDVATGLGYRAAPEMTRTLDDDEKGYAPVSTLGGKQKLTIITESGLYKAIMQRQTGRMVEDSTREQVKAFQRWVTHDVLPAIRRTGTYTTPASATPTPALPSARELALMVIAEADRAEAAERRAVEQEARAIEAEKAVSEFESWVNGVAGAVDLDYAGQRIMSDNIIIAAGIKTGPDLLRAKMEDWGWFYRDPKTNRRRVHTRFIHDGLFKADNSTYTHPRTGERVIGVPKIMITQKGMIRAYRKLLGETHPILFDA